MTLVTLSMNNSQPFSFTQAIARNTKHSLAYLFVLSPLHEPLKQYLL